MFFKKTILLYYIDILYYLNVVHIPNVTVLPCNNNNTLIAFAFVTPYNYYTVN